MHVFPRASCKRLGLALLLYIVATSGILQAEVSTSVTIKNQKFYVDGVEFFVRGMVYRPAPLGIKGMDSDGWGGGGFCSAKLTKYNEWKSNCYDQDFYDGSSATPDRVPPGPAVWFSEIWKRDLPLLNNMSVNVLRVYSFNPYTSTAASKEMGGSGMSEYFGKNHIPFMDVVDSYKMKVMVPLFSSYDAFALEREDVIKQSIVNIVEEVGNHPALFSYVVGSDWPLDSNSLSRLESMIRLVKTSQSSIHNRTVPVTHCFSRNSMTVKALGNLSIDYICVNGMWNGPTEIAQLYLGNGSNSLVGIAKAKGWPILVGEMGANCLSNELSESNPNWFNSLWSAVVEGYEKGSAGAVYFEYSDNPYSPKTGLSPCSVFEQRPRSNGVLNSTQPNVFWADSIFVNLLLFKAITNGSLNGIPINYSTKNLTEYLLLAKQVVKAPISLETANVQAPPALPSPSSGIVDEQLSATGGKVILASEVVSWFESPAYAIYVLCWVVISVLSSSP